MRASHRIALLVLAILALGAGSAASAGTGLASSTKPKVGSVGSLGGTGDLQRSGQRLANGAALRRGDRIVMGAGVTATLSLKRPKGVSADADLVKLVDAPGTSHAVSTSRTATGKLVVKIVTIG